MRADGIRIDDHRSNLVDEHAHIKFDCIVTVCGHTNENSPHIPRKNAKLLHHNFFDRSKVEGTEAVKHQVFLKAREEIKAYFEDFVKKLQLN